MMRLYAGLAAGRMPVVLAGEDRDALVIPAQIHLSERDDCQVLRRDHWL